MYAEDPNRGRRFSTNPTRFPAPVVAHTLPNLLTKNEPAIRTVNDINRKLHTSGRDISGGTDVFPLMRTERFGWTQRAERPESWPARQRRNLISPSTVRRSRSPKMCWCTVWLNTLLTFTVVVMAPLCHFTPKLPFTVAYPSV